jgi:dihydroflavonol-4-reductase
VNLVLTGGAGFLGRHVVVAALERGHAVSVLTRDVPAAAAALQALGPSLASRVRCLPLDLGDAAALQRTLRECAPDALAHLAARITGTREELFAANVAGTGALLAAAATLPRPPRFVHVSSFAVEDHPPTPYSDSKLAAESLVRAAGLPWVILRPALIYGPGDAGNTQQLVAKLRGGTMWLPRGGAATIQPVFVDDVAQALLHACERHEAVGRVYRLGGPAPVSVRAYREAVREASGGRAAIRGIPLPVFAAAASALALAGRRGGLGALAFHRRDHGVDSTDAQRDLGYRPRPLEEGLRATFASR